MRVLTNDADPNEFEVKGRVGTSTTEHGGGNWLGDGAINIPVVPGVLAVFFMLRDGVAYRDLGADHFSWHDKAKTIQRLLRRLSDLGCAVAMPQPA